MHGLRQLVDEDLATQFEFVHCAQCFKPYLISDQEGASTGVEGVNLSKKNHHGSFWLLTCGHVLCQKDLPLTDSDRHVPECPICMTKQVAYIPLKSPLPPGAAHFFQPITKLLQQLGDTITYQMDNMASYTRHLQIENWKQQENLQILSQKYKKLKAVQHGDEGRAMIQQNEFVMLPNIRASMVNGVARPKGSETHEQRGQNEHGPFKELYSEKQHSRPGEMQDGHLRGLQRKQTLPGMGHARGLKQNPQHAPYGQPKPAQGPPGPAQSHQALTMYPVPDPPYHKPSPIPPTPQHHLSGHHIATDPLSATVPLTADNLQKHTRNIAGLPSRLSLNAPTRIGSTKTFNNPMGPGTNEQGDRQSIVTHQPTRTLSRKQPSLWSMSAAKRRMPSESGTISKRQQPHRRAKGPSPGPTRHSIPVLQRLMTPHGSP